jgi:hypothetical protein
MAAVLAAAVAHPAMGRADDASIPGAVLLNGGDTDPGQFLANPYKDESAGFSVAPPLGSRVIRRPGGNELVMFVVDAKSWGGDLQKLEMEKTMSLDDYAKARMAEWEKKFRAVQVLDQRMLQFQGKPALRLATSMEAPPDAITGGGKGGAPRTGSGEMISVYQQQLLVQTQEKQFMALTFYAPLKDRDTATQTFDAMVGSLELIDPTTVKARRVAAVIAGRKWLESQTAEMLKDKLSPQPQLYRMIIGGKDVGYLQFTEGEGAQGAFKGVQSVMQSRTFGDQVVLGQNTAFWAYSHGPNSEQIPHYSSWDNIIKTLVNETVAGNPPRVVTKTFWLEISGTLHLEGDTQLSDEELKRLQAEREEKIRKDPSHLPPEIAVDPRRYHLLVNIDGDNSQHLNQGSFDKDLPQEAPAFLPAILEYSWPRLVDLSKPSEMSFWVYNVATRTLALRTLIVSGKKERIAVAGKQQECWKCVDELDPGSTTLWVDSSGRTVSMRTSDQTVLVPTTETEMKQKWSEQLKRLTQ